LLLNQLHDHSDNGADKNAGRCAVFQHSYLVWLWCLNFFFNPFELKAYCCLLP